MQQSGKLIYATMQYHEYQEGHNDANRLALIYIIAILGLAVMLFLFHFTVNLDLNVIMTIILFLYSPIFVILLLSKLSNWFAIYENGIRPFYLPIKYALRKKKFVSYKEIERLKLESESFEIGRHIWTFRFYLKDGTSFFISRGAGEEAYPILKYIMENIEKKDHFSAEEMGVQFIVPTSESMKQIDEYS